MIKIGEKYRFVRDTSDDALGIEAFFAPNEEIEIIDFEGEELGVQQYRARSVNGNLEQTITESHISSCWPPKFITIEGKTYERKD